MRQVTRKGLITVAAASGVFAVTGYAHADSGAQGSAHGSPGVASGNSVQAPIEVPVNVCGNTVNVVGLLNPAAGNDCSNSSKGGGSSSDQGGSSEQGGGYGEGGSGSQRGSGGGATAEGVTSGSPGVLSGNNVQAPVEAPVNACGNGVSVVGALNPTTGNDCGNGEAAPPDKEVPGKPQDPRDPVAEEPSKPPNEPKTQLVTPVEEIETLAQTGSELPLGVAVPVGAGMLLAGTVLYRKARVRT
ncbi:chaplin family protein [Streptomyces sp. LHD-70]|uniref:chaplin family protein n=1 Tax=Streptomyces sp. LHD-70 TaxID=3072140 RepID=UPI00280FDC20|nr:chaplin family protein [Streptomyces sp. LHD-70]MDQ8703039.1 chaplin family protein [Streptomyces sp. LHD-70]